MSGDPARTLSPAVDQVLDLGPTGVLTLEQAAKLLEVPLAEVIQAAGEVVPWVHADGYTLWSVRQLARSIARERQGTRKPAGRRPKLSLDQARAAVPLIREVGTEKAAAQLGLSRSTLCATLKRHKIEHPFSKRR